MRIPRKSPHIPVRTFQEKRRFDDAFSDLARKMTAVRNVRAAFAGKGEVDDGRQSAYA